MFTTLSQAWAQGAVSARDPAADEASAAAANESTGESSEKSRFHRASYATVHKVSRVYHKAVPWAASFAVIEKGPALTYEALGLNQGDRLNHGLVVTNSVLWGLAIDVAWRGRKSLVYRQVLGPLWASLERNFPASATLALTERYGKAAMGAFALWAVVEGGVRLTDLAMEASCSLWGTPGEGICQNEPRTSAMDQALYQRDLLANAQNPLTQPATDVLTWVGHEIFPHTTGLLTHRNLVGEHDADYRSLQVEDAIMRLGTQIQMRILDEAQNAVFHNPDQEFDLVTFASNPQVLTHIIDTDPALQAWLINLYTAPEVIEDDVTLRRNYQAELKAIFEIRKDTSRERGQEVTRDKIVVADSERLVAWVNSLPVIPRGSVAVPKTRFDAAQVELHSLAVTRDMVRVDATRFKAGRTLTFEDILFLTQWMDAQIKADAGIVEAAGRTKNNEGLKIVDGEQAWKVRLYTQLDNLTQSLTKFHRISADPAVLGTESIDPLGLRYNTAPNASLTDRVRSYLKVADSPNGYPIYVQGNPSPIGWSTVDPRVVIDPLSGAGDYDVQLVAGEQRLQLPLSSSQYLGNLYPRAGFEQDMSHAVATSEFIESQVDVSVIDQIAVIERRVKTLSAEIQREHSGLTPSEADYRAFTFLLLKPGQKDDPEAVQKIWTTATHLYRYAQVRGIGGADFATWYERFLQERAIP